MTKPFASLLLALSLVVMLMLNALASGGANPPAAPNIVLDGRRDPGYTLLADDPAGDLANPGPGSWPGTLWADQTALYVADDGTYLYVYVDLPAYAQSVSSGEIGLAIDTTGDVPNSGGGADPWGNAITYAYTSTHNNVGETPVPAVNIIRPDFVVRGNIPGIPNNPPDNNNGWTELRAWNGSAWTGGGQNWGGISPGEQVGTHIAYDDNDGVEFAIPWADLGLAPAIVNLEFFSTQKGVTKGAFDTIPSDDQSAGWDDPTTQRRLATYVPTPTTPVPTQTLTRTPTQSTGTPTIIPSTPTPTSGAGDCAGAAPGDDTILTTEIFHDSTLLQYRDPQGSIPITGTATLRLRTCSDDVQQVDVWVWKTGDPLGAPSNIYPAAVEYSQNSYDYWSYPVPGPGSVIDQWYQFKVTDGTRTGYYHVLASSGNSGPGQWSDTLIDRSWKLGTLVPPPPDYDVPAWMQDAVIYQIFPDRFRDGSSVYEPAPGTLVYGPNTCGGGPCAITLRSDWNGLPTTSPNYGIEFFGGDLQGVIDKINAGYFNDLGINTIYFNPIFNASSNHGYDANDYYGIRPYFGDAALFEALIAAADAHNLRIILDLVYNHAGSDSKYMDGYGLNRWVEVGACEDDASPYRSWFTAGSNGSGCENDWKWRGWWNFETIPELQEIDPVKDFFYRGGSPQSPGGVSVTQYWLDRGIAGYRFDVAQDISLGWFAELRTYIKGTAGAYGDPDYLMLGEVTGGCDWNLYKSYLTENGLDSVMNYCFRDWAIAFANGNAPSSFDASFNSFRELMPPSAWLALMNLVDSHDSTRALRLLGDDKSKQKLLVILQMTLPGAPSVYYGDEVALTGGGDPDNRRTYPWADTGGSPDLDMLAHYQEVIGIRNAHSALRGGDIATLLIDDGNHLYSYFRWNVGEKIVVALNNGADGKTASIPVAGRLDDGATLIDVLNSNAPYAVVGGAINLSLAGRWGAILVVDSEPLPDTPTPTATSTGVWPTPTPTPTAAPSETATPTPTLTPGLATGTPTADRTPTPTPTSPPETPTPTAAPSETATPTPTPTITRTASPTLPVILWLPLVLK
jgi:glycosidase